MFAIKGRLKVTLFVVGALVVSWGMYAGFQVDEVYGGWAYKHDTEITYDERKYSSSSSKKMVTCTICNKVKREQKKTISKYKVYKITKHIHINEDGDRWTASTTTKYVGIVKKTTWSWTGACPSSQCSSNN
jgi:hypothetical protein